MSAGRGIWHSEKNNTTGADVHFIQMWVPPDTESIDPGYQQLDINPELDRGGLVRIASGRGHAAAIAIRQKDAVLWGGRLKPGEVVSVPDAAFVHVYVARGAATLQGAGTLARGDAVRLTAAGSPTLTASETEGAEVLLWEMQAGLRAA
jgi:redox-sensitive bicupin YhaK (pirin superfamily)